MAQTGQERGSAAYFQAGLHFGERFLQLKKVMMMADAVLQCGGTLDETGEPAGCGGREPFEGVTQTFDRDAHLVQLGWSLGLAQCGEAGKGMFDQRGKNVVGISRVV